MQDDEDDVKTMRVREITDKFMVAAIESQCVRGDEGVRSWYVVDVYGRYVQDLKEAAHTIGEAVEWLTQRGLAKLIQSAKGVLVVLVNIVSTVVPYLQGDCSEPQPNDLQTSQL